MKTNTSISYKILQWLNFNPLNVLMVKLPRIQTPDLFVFQTTLLQLSVKASLLSYDAIRTKLNSNIRMHSNSN